MESPIITKVRELPIAFITELNQQNFPVQEFDYVGLGSACENGDLQRLEITATDYGWTLYNCFKEAWIGK